MSDSASPAAAAAPPPQAAPAAADPSSTSLTPPSVASPNAASTLALFLAQPSVAQRYSDSTSAFTAARAALHSARADREKFQAKCNANPPAIQLPASLGLHLTKKAKLAPVAGDASFYSECTAELQRIERDATEAAYKALLAAKDKHLKHLEALAHPASFMKTHEQSYKKFLDEYSSNYAAEIGHPAVDSSSPPAATPAPSPSSSPFAFPLSDAMLHFRTHLQSFVQRSVMQSTEEAAHEARTKAQAAAEELKAQEDVLAGASSGKTIQMIADGAIDKKLKPIQQQIKQLSGKQPRVHASAAPASASSSSRHLPHYRKASPSSSSHTVPPRSRFPSDANKQHKRKAGSANAPLHITAEDDRRSVSSRSFPGHAGNRSADRPPAPQQRKNFTGGDRSRMRPKVIPSSEPRSNHRAPQARAESRDTGRNSSEQPNTKRRHH